MRPRRRHERFVRRLETEFSADGREYRAISSDFSCGGLFIRTNHAFAPGTLLDIVVHLPQGNASRITGRVKRAIKTPVVSLKNGMGIEIINKDPAYLDFMATFHAECEREADAALPGSAAAREQEVPGTKPEPASEPEFIIIACPSCRVKNKIRSAKFSLGPRCGKCGAPLKPPA
ncbi:MAG: PilZ domain-containing protein [Nitrospiraceae bacterium]|nr:PilZ domain-containing protein [Nitrospiraceae bacterium]